MIAEKFWRSLRGQLNKLANTLWTADPIAQMQYEYDLAVEHLRDGRAGLEQYRALVERVSRQVAAGRSHVASLDAKVKAYLQTGDRETAGKFALELQKATKNVAENEAQLVMHEQAYNNNLSKIKLAGNQLSQIREKIHKYNAELKMSRAEAEMAKLAQDFHFDVTTDFGQIEQVVQDKISLNKAQTRVAADLSDLSDDDLQREQMMEQALAEQALRDFEVQARLAALQQVKLIPGPQGQGPNKEPAKPS
jgi:phage shock protein A